MLSVNATPGVLATPSANPTPSLRATPSSTPAVNATPSTQPVNTPRPLLNAQPSSTPRPTDRTDTQAQNQACAPLDLRDERCSSGASRIPSPRDQLRTNFCFANTLADVYSYNDCAPYSALHLGLSSHLQHRREQQQNPNAEPPKSDSLNLGASVESTNELIRRAGGLCLESQFSSRRRELMHPAQVERFLQSFATPEGQARLSRDCSPRQPGGLEIATTRRSAASPAELTAAIHRALNSRQPAMINFASGVLSGPSEPPKPGHTPEAPGQPDHYSNIIGRREINGRCHFLVRDSNPIGNSRWPRDGHALLIPADALVPSINEVAVPRPTSPLAPLPQTAPARAATTSPSSPAQPAPPRTSR